MDSIGDWVYLIFIGIALVASAFKPKKKQHVEKAPPVVNNPNVEPQTSTARPVNAPQPSVPTWMDILRELEEKSSDVSKPKAKKTKPQPFLQTSSIETTERRNELSSNLSSNITEKIQSFSNHEISETTPSSIKLNFEDMDEVKRGFVYSEIFNRKY